MRRSDIRFLAWALLLMLLMVAKKNFGQSNPQPKKYTSLIFRDVYGNLVDTKGIAETEVVDNPKTIFDHWVLIVHYTDKRTNLLKHDTTFRKIVDSAVIEYRNTSGVPLIDTVGYYRRINGAVQFIPKNK